MKKLIAILTFITAFGCFNTVDATHITGGDFSATCLGNNQFLIRLQLFRDCSGVGAPTSTNFSISSSCGTINANGVLQNPGGTEVSQLCPDQIGNSTCNNGFLPGMQMYFYEATVTLNPQCDDWTVGYGICCHNSTQNLVGQPGSWFDLQMNTIADSCNNTPAFTAQPIPYVCNGQPVTYNYGVVEPDGDSLYFDFICSRSGVTTNNTYVNPWTCDSAIHFITIDNNTGQINFTPQVNGNWVVVVACWEIDKNSGDTLSRTMRELQFVVQNCSNKVPTSTTGTVDTSLIVSSQGTAAAIGPYGLELCQGDSVCFTVAISDSNSTDTLNLESNVDLALPGATFTYNAGNPATATICWVAPSNQGFFNSFIIAAEDDACPVTGIQTYVYTVQVLPSVNASPNVTICYGDTAQLEVNGGTAFDWTSPSGGDPINVGTNFECDTCQTTWASPDSTTTYYIESNLSTVCSSIDSVTVTVVHPPDPTITSVDPLCADDNPITMDAATNGGTWTGDLGINNPTGGEFNPNLAGAGTHTVYYQVAIGSCVSYDTLEILVNPVPPAPTAVGNTFCPGELLSGVGTNETDNIIWYNSEGDTIHTGQTLLNYGQVLTDDTVYVTQTVLGCESGPMPVYINTHPEPTADFIPNPITGLVPLDVDFENTSYGGTPNYSYEWTIEDPNNPTTSTVEDEDHTFSQPGEYTITLVTTDDNGCIDEHTLTVVVDGNTSMFLPNVFSPNNDQKNDVFGFPARGIDEVKVTILNRWGRIVHENSIKVGDDERWELEPNYDPNVGGLRPKTLELWDGGKQPDGVYYYFIEAINFEGKALTGYYYNQNDRYDVKNGEVYTSDNPCSGEHCHGFEGYITVVGSGN